MPIYAYRCDACGFRKDVLQKLSEPALTRCPACEAESFVKQLSAPAFQLKGTGWYVTDFRDNGKKAEGGSGANDTDSAGAAKKAAGSTDGGNGAGNGKAAGDGASGSASGAGGSADAGSPPASSGTGSAAGTAGTT
ncbi:MAG: FmdB family zinc ribbon protein [Hyphomicrobiales bacterium]